MGRFAQLKRVTADFLRTLMLPDFTYLGSWIK